MTKRHNLNREAGTQPPIITPMAARVSGDHAGYNDTALPSSDRLDGQHQGNTVGRELDRDNHHLAGLSPGMDLKARLSEAGPDGTLAVCIDDRSRHWCCSRCST